MVHQPAQQLHGHILEGQRRAVEQLKHEAVRRDLHQRRHRRMAEGGIGLIDHALEIGILDGAAGEGADHLEGDVLIGLAGKACDGFGVKLRPGLGQVKPAVTGKALKKNICEIENRCVTTRTDISHRAGSLYVWLQSCALANLRRAQSTGV